MWALRSRDACVANTDGNLTQTPHQSRCGRERGSNESNFKLPVSKWRDGRTSVVVRYRDGGHCRTYGDCIRAVRVSIAVFLERTNYEDIRDCGGPTNAASEIDQGGRKTSPTSGRDSCGVHYSFGRLVGMDCKKRLTINSRTLREGGGDRWDLNSIGWGR